MRNLRFLIVVCRYKVEIGVSESVYYISYLSLMHFYSLCVTEKKLITFIALITCQYIGFERDRKFMILLFLTSISACYLVPFTRYRKMGLLEHHRQLDHFSEKKFSIQFYFF